MFLLALLVEQVLDQPQGDAVAFGVPSRSAWVIVVTCFLTVAGMGGPWSDGFGRRPPG